MQRILSLLNIFSTSPSTSTSATLSNSSHLLFGSSKPWNTSDLAWQPVTDQVRGGSSTASLTTTTTNTSEYSVLFSGYLDTSTLGGAGFASVTTKPYDADTRDTAEGSENSQNGRDLLWNLAAYDGIEVVLGSGDVKRYALTIKDEVPHEKRSDGREKAVISWEADFNGTATSDGKEKGYEAARVVWLPWDAFKPTYRGREKGDAPPLQTQHIRRFGLMMRSFFDEQDGDFGLEIKSICAGKAG